MWTKEDETKLEKYFFYGLNDKEVVLNGIIFLANQIILRKEPMDKMYDIPIEEKFKNLTDEAVSIYKQFFRFVNIHDTTIKSEEKMKQYFNYERENQEELQEKVQKRIKELIQENKIFITKAGLYFNKEQEAYYYKEYSYANPNLENNAWWTRDVSELLYKLKELEKKDKIEYFDKWLLVKWQRTKHSEDNQKETEILEKAYKAFSERKKSLSQKIEDQER